MLCENESVSNIFCHTTIIKQQYGWTDESVSVYC